MNTKACSKCGVEKPLSSFHKRNDRPIGVLSACKECKKISRRNSYLANKEKEKAQALAYHHANRASSIARMRRYYWDNHEEQSKRGREWGRANKEKRAKANRENRKKYPSVHEARGAIPKAIRAGKLPPQNTQTCVICGKGANDYHHHNGYDVEHYLDVVPVCTQCHGLERRIIFD